MKPICLALILACKALCMEIEMQPMCYSKEDYDKLTKQQDEQLKLRKEQEMFEAVQFFIDGLEKY